MVLFADDTNIQIRAANEDSLNKKIKRVMQQLLTWFHGNGLVINTEKTIAMSFFSVINQLDAQNFCFTVSLFHASTCFEHMCSSSGGQNCITQPMA